MTWKEFFNRPKCVFGLVAAIVVIWLLFHPQVVVDTVNNTVMPLLTQLLIVGFMIWGLKVMFLGGKNKGK